jgi:hypothetical protein
MTHPPPYVRIILQKDILKYLNMPLAADRVEDMAIPIKNFVSSSEYHQQVDSFGENFMNWVATARVQEFFCNFCKLISQAIDSDKEKSDPIGFRSYKFEQKDEEAKWERHLKMLIREVSEYNVYFGIDDRSYSPTDILNVFWLAKELEYTKTKGETTAQPFQVIWRFWLSKYLDKHQYF